MNTHTNVLAVEDADSIENNKKFVTHDLCICFYELAFKSKRLPKEKLAGPPSTKPVVLNIFNAIKEYSDIKKIGGVSKSMLKQSRLNFDKIEKCK